MRKFIAGIYPPLFLAVCLLILSSSVKAEVMVRPQFMFLSDSVESSGTKTTRDRQLVDFAAGYRMPEGPYFGILYGTERRSTKTEVTSSGATTMVDGQRTSYGASLGWLQAGEFAPYLITNYFFTSDYTESNTNYSGTGYGADIGIRFSVRKFFIGLQLSYKLFEYKKTKTGSTETELAQPQRYSNIDPYFSLFFEL